MKIKLIVGLLLTLVLVIFAVQNAESVTVKFLVWQVGISRALLILVSAGTGALAYAIATISRRRKDKGR